MSDQLSGLTRGRSRSLRSPRRSLDSCFARRFTSAFLLIHEVADCVGSLGGRGAPAEPPPRARREARPPPSDRIAGFVDETSQSMEFGSLLPDEGARS